MMRKKNHQKPDQKRRFWTGAADGAAVLVTGALLVGRGAAILGLGAGSFTGFLTTSSLPGAFLDSLPDLLGVLFRGRTGAFVGPLVGALVGLLVGFLVVGV
jgi:hypothetical protein